MKKLLISILALSCLLVSLFTFPALALDTVLYVAPSAAGAADGSSWEDAMTLDDAWSAATPGTKIFMREGTYTRTSVLTLKDGVSVYGGFAGTEVSEDERALSDVDVNGIVEAWEFTHATLLTGNIRFFNGLNNADAVVDGLTMTSTGNTTAGSVISLFTGNVLQNAIVTSSNNATRGVVYLDGGKLLSSYIHHNVTNSDRGCISIYYNNGSEATVSHCRIENNKAQYGGGIYSRSSQKVSIVNNLIIGNEATMRGGGVYLGSGSNPPANAWVINNTITANTVSNAEYTEGGNGDGSGIFAEGGDYVYNNVITGNTGPVNSQQVANSNKGGNFHFKYNAIGNLAGIDWTAVSGTVINENNIDLNGSESLFSTGYIPAPAGLLDNGGDKTLYPDYVVNSLTLKDLKRDVRVQGGQIDIGAYENIEPAADPEISLTGAAVPYDGAPHTLTATTNPAGLPVTYTYNGSAIAPSDIGSYTVVATVDCTDNDIYYYGTATAILEIKAVHTITASAGANGTISPTGAVLVTDGTDQSFTFIPAAGYAVDTVTVDGAEVTLTEGVYTFENVTEDHTINVTFMQVYHLDIAAGPGGTIASGTSGDYPEGTVINIAAAPSPGNVFNKWTSSAGGTFGNQTSSTTTFTMPAEAVTITATFNLIYDGSDISPIYSIRATAGTGGSISPSGIRTVTENKSITFTITADQGYLIEDVLVDGMSVGAVNTYTFTAVSANHTIEAKFVHDCPSKPFTDVDTTQWYHEGIDYVLTSGLFNGTSATTFEPDSAMTRSMLVTVLHRLEGVPAASSGNPFADVAAGTWYTDAIAWAAENDIVKGYDADTFGPNDPITREQMAAVLYRYASYKGYNLTTSNDLDAFADAGDVSAWALAAMKWAVGEELITGVSSTSLDPAGNASRAQVATILMRFVENIVK